MASNDAGVALFRKLRSLGWRSERTGKNHVRWLLPDGRKLVSSNFEDKRHRSQNAVRNMLRQLRRMGVSLETN